MRLRSQLAPWCAAATLCLGGCGFQLQGHTPLPAVVKTPYVEAPDRQSDFVQGLRNALLSNGAQLAPENGKSSAVISVLQDQMIRRVVSVSAANLPSEYELTYTVRVSVTAGDKELLPAQDVSRRATTASASRCCSPRTTRKTSCARTWRARWRTW